MNSPAVFSARMVQKWPTSARYHLPPPQKKYLCGAIFTDANHYTHRNTILDHHAALRTLAYGSQN
jgi:hypothetical protein